MVKRNPIKSSKFRAKKAISKGHCPFRRKNFWMKKGKFNKKKAISSQTSSSNNDRENVPFPLQNVLQEKNSSIDLSIPIDKFKQKDNQKELFLKSNFNSSLKHSQLETKKSRNEEAEENGFELELIFPIRKTDSNSFSKRKNEKTRMKHNNENKNPSLEKINNCKRQSSSCQKNSVRNGNQNEDSVEEIENRSKRAPKKVQHFVIIDSPSPEKKSSPKVSPKKSKKAKTTSTSIIKVENSKISSYFKPKITKKKSPCKRHEESCGRLEEVRKNAFDSKLAQKHLVKVRSLLKPPDGVELSSTHLQTICDAYGLKKTGNRSLLITRIRKAFEIND